MSLRVRNDFVVYGYAREGADRFGNVGTYYYIGKGTPKRPHHCSNRTIKCPKNKEDIHVLHENLDEENAFRIEKELIAKYGRRDLHPDWGILYNRTDGGEGTAGSIRSEESKKRYSASKLGDNNPSSKKRNWCHSEIGLVLNKTASEVVKEYPEHKSSQSGLCKLALGKTKYHFGWIAINEELDVKLGTEQLSIIFSPEYCKKFIENCKKEHKKKAASRAVSGPLNPMYGKTGKDHPSFGLKRSEETCYKISEKARKRFVRRDWYHPDHGRIENVLCCELIEMFPEHKLSQGTLSSVASGDRRNHKGWTCLGVSGNPYPGYGGKP